YLEGSQASLGRRKRRQAKGLRQKRLIRWAFNPSSSLGRVSAPRSSYVRLDCSGRNRRVSWKLCAQAPLEFLAHLYNFHSRHHDELAAQHLARLVIIGQLAGYVAILAILIPAEVAIRYGLRTNELEAAQKRVALRHLKFL